jgi:hypothetical protein
MQTYTNTDVVRGCRLILLKQRKGKDRKGQKRQDKTRTEQTAVKLENITENVNVNVNVNVMRDIGISTRG